MGKNRLNSKKSKYSIVNLYPHGPQRASPMLTQPRGSEVKDPVTGNFAKTFIVSRNLESRESSARQRMLYGINTLNRNKPPNTNSKAFHFLSVYRKINGSF